MIKRKITKIILLVLILINAYITKTIYAQVGTSGVAVPIEIEESFNINGLLICNNEEGFIGCQSPYDPSMYGVVTTEPSVALEMEGDEAVGTASVISSGVAKVRISSINGSITSGDWITSSDILGVGQRADQNGYVIGSALESYESDNPEQIGTILVALNIHPAAGLTGARSDLLAALRQGTRAPIFDPLDSLRYFLAALIVIISFGLGFVYFGRVGKTGVEAIGRNPLASKMIQISVIIHVVVTIAIILVGLFLAYLILIL